MDQCIPVETFRISAMEIGAIVRNSAEVASLSDEKYADMVRRTVELVEDLKICAKDTFENGSFAQSNVLSWGDKVRRTAENLIDARGNLDLDQKKSPEAFRTNRQEFEGALRSWSHSIRLTLPEGFQQSPLARGAHLVSQALSLTR